MVSGVKFRPNEHLYVARDILERRGCRVEVYEHHIRIFGGDERTRSNVSSAIAYITYGYECTQHVVKLLHDMGLSVGVEDGCLIAF